MAMISPIQKLQTKIRTIPTMTMIRQAFRLRARNDAPV
jgi:hypothetical protein